MSATAVLAHTNPAWPAPLSQTRTVARLRSVTKRYGETTARDRFHAPYVSVFVVTILYAVGALALRFVIGDSVPAHAVMSALPAGILWNLVLTLPVYALVRRLHPPAEAGDRAYEVRLLG